MSKIDPLEELMRSRLLDGKPANNSWNVPPDSVFEDAMNAIDAEKKDRRKPFFFILFVFAIILAISLLTYRLNQKITHLNTEFNELKSQSVTNELSPEKNFANDAISGNISNEKNNESLSKTKDLTPIQSNSLNSASPNNSKKNIKPNRSNTSRIINASPTKNFTFPLKLQSSITNGENNLFNTRTSIIENKEQNSSFGDNSLNKLDQDQTINSLATKHFLIRSNLQLISLPEEMSELLHAVKMPEKESKKSSFSLFAFAGANISSIDMKNMSETSFSLTGYEEYCVGYQLGIGSAYQLNNKWALNSNLSYTTAKNRSDYLADYKYDQGKEYTNNLGEVLYVDNMVIESPMHPMTETVSFKTTSSGPVHGDMMQTKVAFDQILHLVNLGIGVDYTIHETDKTKITSGLGIRGQYLVSMKENVDMQLYHGAHMMMEKSASHNSLDNMNRTLVAPFGKIGFDFKIDDQNTIMLTGSYYHPLTSIRQAGSAVEPTTYLKNIEFSVLFQRNLN